MDGCGQTGFFDLSPKHVVIGMVEKAAFEEYRADRYGFEAKSSHPMQFLNGEAGVLKREDRGGEQAPRSLAAQVADPVVVGTSKRQREVGIFDGGEVFAEQSGENQGLVHSHAVHVGNPRGRGIRAGIDRIRPIGIERADFFRRHSGAPDGGPVDPPAVHQRRLASVQDNAGGVLIFVIVERGACRDAIGGVEILLPNYIRFEYMAVGVNYLEFFVHIPTPLLTGAKPISSNSASSVPVLLIDFSLPPTVKFRILFREPLRPLDWRRLFVHESARLDPIEAARVASQHPGLRAFRNTGALHVPDCLHTSSASGWYMSDAHTPMFSNFLYVRNTRSSSDSKEIMHCWLKASLGSRFSGVLRSLAYSLTSKSQCSSSSGSHAALDSKIAILRRGYRSRNPDNSTCASQVIASKMKLKVDPTITRPVPTPVRVRISPGEIGFSLTSMPTPSGGVKVCIPSTIPVSSIARNSASV